MSKKDQLIPVERISSKIFLIRNEKVLLDFDLAELYGVETRALKQAVRRNINRFPKDFMFQITKSEWNELITVCDNLGDRKFSPRPPFTFTEQGVAMLSSVLNSERAVKVNIAIMRAFVKMRRILESNESLAKKLKQLEKETKEKFAEHQQQISLIFEAIKELVTEKEKPKRRIGF
jgi:phage regulator Rha-like protein